jgi:hypothetical protein
LNLHKDSRDRKPKKKKECFEFCFSVLRDCAYLIPLQNQMMRRTDNQISYCLETLYNQCEQTIYT